MRMNEKALSFTHPHKYLVALCKNFKFPNSIIDLKYIYLCTTTISLNTRVLTKSQYRYLKRFIVLCYDICIINNKDVCLDIDMHNIIRRKNFLE